MYYNFYNIFSAFFFFFFSNSNYRNFVLHLERYSTETTRDHRNTINICISSPSDRPVANSVALVPVRRTNHLGRITKIIYCTFPSFPFLATPPTRLVYRRKDKPRSSKDSESTTCICIRHSRHVFIITGGAKRCFLLRLWRAQVTSQDSSLDRGVIFLSV